MLLKFRHIKTRKVILDQLMTKFEVIMDQFIKEVGIVENTFLVSRSRFYYHLIPKRTPALVIFKVCIETITSIVCPLTVRFAANIIAGHYLTP